MAVWAADDPRTDPPRLVFEFDPRPAAVEGSGTLVGELAINGNLCLETGDGSTIWPTYNPRPPFRRRA